MIRRSVRLLDAVEKGRELFQRNRLTLLMAALFFVGMLYGALLVGLGEEDLLNALRFMTEGYLDRRTEQSVFSTFFNSLCSSGVFVLLLFLLGFSAISAPVILFLPAFKGLGLGASMGYLYTVFGWKGVAFSVAMILPATLFSTFSIILSGKEAFRLSTLFLATFLPRLRGTISAKVVKCYCGKFGILLGIVLVSAGIDCVTAFLFAGVLRM